jgi:hypothetical protein
LARGEQRQRGEGEDSARQRSRRGSGRRHFQRPLAFRSQPCDG